MPKDSATLTIEVKFNRREKAVIRKRVMNIGQDRVVTPVKEHVGEMPRDWFASLVYHILDSTHTWGGGPIKGDPGLHRYNFTFTPRWVGVSRADRHQEIVKRLEEEASKAKTLDHVKKGRVRKRS